MPVPEVSEAPGPGEAILNSSGICIQENCQDMSIDGAEMALSTGQMGNSLPAQ